MTDIEKEVTFPKEFLPNKEAFQRVYEDLELGNELTLVHIGEVFGTAFWIMLVYALMDAQEAARAVQGAINSLRADAIAHAAKQLDEVKKVREN